MPKNHLKTIKAPKTWPIKRKNSTFIKRPNPGANKIELSIPITIILKLLNKAKTTKEVKKILRDEEIIVNGKRRKDEKYPVGLLDVLTIKQTGENYVILINKYNKLYLQEITEKDSQTKICKVTNKKHTKKGKIQIQTMDGRTIVKEKSDEKTGDSIVITIPKQELKETIKLESGAKILLYKGKHVGKIAEALSIQKDVLKFKHESNEFETKKEYAIVLGKEKPIITIK